MTQAQHANGHCDTESSSGKRDYDAILIVGFGGPEQREDVFRSSRT